jgi:hypothetical protein
MTRGARRTGSVLVEFAVAMFAFVTIAFAGIELGRAFFTAQIAGEGARIAARESATKPGALGTPGDPAIFIERYTVIDIDRLRDPAGGAFNTDADMDGDVDVDDLFQVLPSLHIALRSVMIRENRAVNGIERRLLRFPGALFRNPAGGVPLGEDLIVKIPDVVAEGATTDVELSNVVTLNYDSTTNTIRTEVRYHHQFSVFMATSGTGGPLLPPIDPATITIINPTELGAFSETVDMGLGRPGTLRGFFRNATIHIRQFGAARKDIP